jgi:hypothetical protein
VVPGRFEVSCFVAAVMVLSCCARMGVGRLGCCCCSWLVRVDVVWVVGVVYQR